MTRQCKSLDLTRRQMEVLRAMCQYGCRKVVAYHLGVTPQAIDTVLRAARGRMRARTDLQAVLAFDRWQRGMLA